MTTVSPRPEPTQGAAGQPQVGRPLAFDSADRSLIKLGQLLKDRGYRFTAVTPASHAQVASRSSKGRAWLTDIFGWSRSFAAGDVSESDLTCMADAGVLEIAGPVFRSNVRFSTLGDQLFVHSAFPTEQGDAVFFGPDTYRFARLVRQAIGSIEPRSSRRRFKILDVGAGSGAGGLHAAAVAARMRPIVTLTDVNPRALRFCKINAALNATRDAQTVESDLYASVDGYFDLIISNPPYLVDPLARLYRHGGGELGFELSVRTAAQGLSRLAPGGRLVLYTGSAIMDGVDLFQEALSSKLAKPGVRFAYEEIDPDVFGEELAHSPYDRADRIAVVGVTIDV